MISPRFKPFLSSLFLLGCLVSGPLLGQTLEITRRDSTYRVSLSEGNLVYLSAPEDGLWSIALGWENDWPADWRHTQPTALTRQGEWEVLSGKLQLPQGEWWFQDAYRMENGKVKCIRRFEWKGKEILDRVTLSVRWAVPSAYAKAFLPGILYYGNPSGEKNGPQNVVWHHAQPGDEAFFEEHRYPMPFAGYEWAKGDRHYGAALHTVPSPVYQGNHFDQWWSLGVKNGPLHSELQLLSGPIGFNHQRSIAKALQQGPLPYKDTYLRVRPGTVIEKTFYLEAYPVKAKGSGFQKPVYTSLDLFKPFYTEDLPRYEDILRSKYRFAQSRWIEGPGYAGFNMYPSHVKPQIVLGWAGQSEAPAYALQALADELHDTLLWQKVQRSMDHIIRSPLDAEGFCVIYDVQTQAWRGKDPVSQGQAMNSIALAIEEGRKNGKVRTAEWEGFLQRAADVFAKRILSPDWSPVNTAEAFFIAPLLAAHRLLGNVQYRKAAFKAADYYAERHLDMQEPYWGGTLDATCEDKEGAWGAFQGFLAAYESSQDKRYLEYAKHACDVTISYTAVWDIPLPAGRLADHFFKTRGWTGVSAQNQHLDVFGVVIAPSVYKMGLYLGQEDLKRLARTMYLSCGQLIAPNGAHGEQIQETNFAQHGEMDDVFKLRGGYSESWTVFWITAHFLHAAAQFKALGVTL